MFTNIVSYYDKLVMLLMMVNRADGSIEHRFHPYPRQLRELVPCASSYTILLGVVHSQSIDRSTDFEVVDFLE